MAAYLFSGWFTQWHQGQFVDNCHNLILYGGDAEGAGNAFEKILLNSGQSQEQPNVKIEKVVGAPVLEQMLAETGFLPIDWQQVADETLKSVESSEGEEQSQGYWVDCNEWPRPEPLSPSLESLRAELPDEIRDGLNWLPDKTYFFLVSILSPVAPQPLYADEDEQEGNEEQEPERASPFPQVAEKELAVLVRARNSVVAAWLWRKYAPSTPLAANAIRVDPVCESVPIA